MSNQYDGILQGIASNKKMLDAIQKENNNIRNEVTELKTSIRFLNDQRVKNYVIINGIECQDNGML